MKYLMIDMTYKNIQLLGYVSCDVDLDRLCYTTAGDLWYFLEINITNLLGNIGNRLSYLSCTKSIEFIIIR